MTAGMWTYFTVMLMCNTVAALIIVSLAGAFGKRYRPVCTCTQTRLDTHAACTPHAQTMHTA